MAKNSHMFTEGNATMRNLHGKGANLAEMTKPRSSWVPQGFTITTEACTQYYEDGRSINDEIMAQIMEAITKKWKELLVRNSVTKKILCLYPFVLVREHLCRV